MITTIHVYRKQKASCVLGAGQLIYRKGRSLNMDITDTKMSPMSFLNDNLLNKYICLYVTVGEKYNPCQVTEPPPPPKSALALLRNISDLTGFDEVSRNNSLSSFSFRLTYIKRIERNVSW